MDIKVGDTVQAIWPGCGYYIGDIFTVAAFDETRHCLHHEFVTLIDRKGIKHVGCLAKNFKKINKPHTGKILIMVDENDENKIIARDLIAGKTAEAKCSPKDEWDFNKGAKLAFERLTEPEKPKGWTGKVVCVSYTVIHFMTAFMAACDCGNFFTVGKVYTVNKGKIVHDNKSEWITNHIFTDVDDLNEYFSTEPITAKFIEYKGGAE